MVHPSGHINGVLVERGDGEFSCYSSDQFRIDGNSPVLLPSVKLKVEALCNEIPLVWRKDQALRELLEKKKISSETFNDFHTNFENALNQLKADAQDTLDKIDKQIDRCSQQIKELRSAMIYLEIEREIGKVDDKSYQMALEMMQNGLKQINAEKADLESIRNKLSNMLLGEKLPTAVEKQKEKEPTPVPATSPTLPEPPVIVHVKDLE
jgi:chromosome segregation ATPase